MGQEPGTVHADRQGHGVKFWGGFSQIREALKSCVVYTLYRLSLCFSAFSIERHKKAEKYTKKKSMGRSQHSHMKIRSVLSMSSGAASRKLFSGVM